MSDNTRNYLMDEGPEGEEILTSNELVFRQIFENISGVYLLLNAEDYCITAASDGFLEEIKTKRTQIIGSKFFELFQSGQRGPQTENLQQLRTSLEKVKSEGHPDVMPVSCDPLPWHRSESNVLKHRWWQHVNYPVISSGGDTIHILCHIEEVTPIIRQLMKKDGNELNRRITTGDFYLASDCIDADLNLNEVKTQAFDDMLENEEKYRMLVNSIDKGFCIIRMLHDENDQPADFCFVEVNQAFELHTGLKNVEGRKISELVSNLEKYWTETLGKVVLTGKPRRFDHSVEALNREFEVYARPFGKPGERKIAVLFSDITQRLENEYTTAWLTSIIDSSEDAIISKNLNGEITSWNASASRLFGYTAREAVGRNISMIIPRERLGEENDILMSLKRGKRIEHFETVRKHKNGSRVDVSVTVSPIENPDGEIIGASKIARDITKQKEAERKLREMNKTLEAKVEERTKELHDYQLELRALTSELSKAKELERRRLASDLHNNLGQMLAVAKIQVDSLNTNGVSISKNELNELSELLDEALFYTRELMTELKPPPVLEKEEIKEVLTWVVKEMEKYDLKVTIIDDGKPKKLNEEWRNILYESVKELFFNIIKYAGVNEAHLELTRNEDHIKITVRDEGKGFHVTEGRPVFTKNGGYGLFNMRERIDWTGGRFNIVSEPGKGTKSEIYVPLKDSQKRSAAADPELNSG